jgi:glyoxylase-like metal-dependent hydrolase (beta-lactamase superfamily II)/rhodanese-related sulfurtransferase
MVVEDLKIDVKTLVSWLTKKKPATILDIRPKQEREEWSIPGSIHADVYQKLKDGQKNVFSNYKFPDSPIVTVCGAGKTSRIAAEQLKEKGFEAYSLDGGMKAWNFAWNMAEVSFRDLKVVQVRRSAKGCLSYIVGSSNEAIVIDAALDPEVYQNLAKENGWRIRYVMDTHIHADYISRTRELANASNAIHIMVDKASVDYPFSSIRHGDVVSFGKATLEVIHTPGHTLESTSYKIGDLVVFTGDTLFINGVGRPDLKADHDEVIKKSAQLYRSLRRLLELGPSTLVLPAHSSEAVPFDGKLLTSSIGAIKEKLELLKLNENEFIQYTLSRIPPTPPNYLTIAELNKKGSYAGYSPSELEAGANRCAIA